MWVAARPTDDAARFGRRLVEALDTIVPGTARRAVAHLRRDGAALGEDFLAIVLAELSYAAPVTVVVEDLETLASPVVLDELGQLAERAADGVGFVFVSRDDRLPKTLRLRLRDEVAEIRQDTLALSWEEAGEAIQRVAGQTLHPVQVQALHSRTEGWAAGIQLAALSLRDHDDPDRFVEQFAGDDRHVADYLSGEVLALQSPEVTDFLVRVAVLDRLSGPLCDAVTGGTDGQRMLERLDQQSLFIRPLDGRRQWYGYHPLFRDLLRYELRATRPGRGGGPARSGGGVAPGAGRGRRGGGVPAPGERLGCGHRPGPSRRRPLLRAGRGHHRAPLAGEWCRRTCSWPTSMPRS